MKILCPAEVSELHRLLWPTTGDRTFDDSQRWCQQGFKFQALQGFSIGLVQDHGGPCGVLAAVQAEMLRLFLFVRHRETLSDNDIELQNVLGKPLDEAARRQLLAEAMASLLAQCADNGRAVCVVVQDSEVTYREITVSLFGAADPDLQQELVELLLREMPAFCSPHGVINFTFSVLRTKGVAAIREEMDDPTNTLTGAFGHCTQELLNLLLTGKAVSNVFDGSVPMGDSGLFLHGVSQRARIGYLTQLEALCYCQVGSYYKSPQFPVWVIGSSSHFSVGFALEAWVSEESTSEQLFQRVQRVFKQFDPMETGFMEISSLAESLLQLGVQSSILTNEHWMARLVARLELSGGAGIILWDEYWKVISVLLHTNDFELALSGKYDTNVTKFERHPLQRSDSDLARELQAQFDAEDRGGSANSVPANLQIPASDLLAVPHPAVSFDWFYYNGLGSSESHNNGRCPLLTKCRVTLDTSTDVIGKSVPMTLVGTSGGDGSNSLEEVMKTKWPNARIDWLVSPAPSIN